MNTMPHKAPASTPHNTPVNTIASSGLLRRLQVHRETTIVPEAEFSRWNGMRRADWSADQRGGAFAR
jgi:hypothetical protein